MTAASGFSVAVVDTSDCDSPQEITEACKSPRMCQQGRLVDCCWTVRQLTQLKKGGGDSKVSTQSLSGEHYCFNKKISEINGHHVIKVILLKLNYCLISISHLSWGEWGNWTWSGNTDVLTFSLHILFYISWYKYSIFKLQEKCSRLFCTTVRSSSKRFSTAKASLVLSIIQGMRLKNRLAELRELISTTSLVGELPGKWGERLFFSVVL